MRQSVLLVEDQAVVAMDVGELLGEVGYDVVAVARSIDEALDHAWSRRFHAAVLDVKVDGRWTFPVADCLAERNVPMVLMSNRRHDVVPARHRNRPFVAKPFDSRELVVELARATDVLAPLAEPTRPRPSAPHVDELSRAEIRVVRLRTQIARLELLVARYATPEGQELLAQLRDNLSLAIGRRDGLRRG